MTPLSKKTLIWDLLIQRSQLWCSKQCREQPDPICSWRLADAKADLYGELDPGLLSGNMRPLWTVLVWY